MLMDICELSLLLIAGSNSNFASLHSSAIHLYGTSLSSHGGNKCSYWYQPSGL